MEYFGKIHNVMDVLYLDRKGVHLNTVEKLCICKETMIDNQLNDKHTGSYIKLLETVKIGRWPHPSVCAMFPFI